MWGKAIVKWVAATLPEVITELGSEGPERVLDVLAERYREEFLPTFGPRLQAKQERPKKKGPKKKRGG